MTATAKIRIEGEDATAAAWKSALGTAESSAKKMTHIFEAAFAGISIAFIAEMGKRAIELGDAINKASIKAGIGGKAMSELAYAAKLADVDLTSLSTGIKKMQVNLSEAATGSKAPITAFAALGLKFQDLQRLKPEDQFELIADRISKLKDPADRARAATDLFGKAGADLLPLFSDGAAGIAKAREEAEKLGLSFSDEQLKKLTEADDSIKRLDASWQGFWITLTSKVAPALSSVLDLLSGGDSRSVKQKLDDEIQALEFKRNVGGKGAPSSVIEGQRAALTEQLNQLRARRALLDAAPLSGPGSRVYVSAPGYAAVAADEAANKASAKALKAAEKSADQMRMVDFDLNADLDKARDQKLEKVLDEDDKETQAFFERAKEMAKAQKELDHKLSASAQQFKDAFLNAWDDMINTGKFKWDELLKYLVAEFARRGIAKLFDQIFLPKAGGGAGGGDLLDKVFGAIGGVFGGGKASGGAVSAGSLYAVGERGPELFAPGMSGSIIPNHALGGGGNVNMTYNIDARGATMELVRVLPRMFEAHKNSVIAEVDERLKRRKIGVRGS